MIFSFSALFLWEALAARARAGAAAAGERNARAARGHAGRSRAGAPAVPVGVPAAQPARRPSPARRRPPPPRAGRTDVTIKTDLYTADVDTRAACITRVALAEHRDAADATKPYLALQRNAERTFVAQIGPDRRRLAQSPHASTRCCPGPRELAPGQRPLELKLQATAANGDKVVKTLTFHRGSYVIDVAYDITNAGSAPIAPDGVLPVHARHQAARPCRARWRPPSYIGPVIYNEADKYKKVDFGEIDKEAADPTRKPAFTQERRQRLGRAWSSTTSSPRGCRPTRPRRPREFYATQARQRPVRRWRRSCEGSRSRRARPASIKRAAVRRAAGAGRAGQARARASTSSSTTASSPSSPRRCSGCSSGCTASIGNWGWAIIVHDDHHQERVLSAQPRERALDGEDEGRSRRR